MEFLRNQRQAIGAPSPHESDRDSYTGATVEMRRNQRQAIGEPIPHESDRDSYTGATVEMRRNQRQAVVADHRQWRGENGL